jgi:ADP-ribose pyrophosphatase YjhB (NUDIX family)
MHPDVWQIFDADGNALAGRGRDSALKNPDREKGDTDYVGGVAVWFIQKLEKTPDNPTGIYVLFQQRSQFVDNNKGLWDVSAGGHINLGETNIETAIRETKEEIGVEIDPKRLIFMAHIPYPDYLMHHYAFVYDWPEHTLDTSMFHFDDKEVEQVKWVPLSNFEQFIDEYGKNVVKKSTELRRIVHQTALDHFKEVE